VPPQWSGPSASSGPYLRIWRERIRGENHYILSRGPEFHQPKGMFPQVGDVLVPKVRQRRCAEFPSRTRLYDHGPWAEKFVAKGNEMGGKIRLEHMSETPPRWVQPIRYRHREYEIVSLGPPRAQGLSIGVALGIVKRLGIHDVKPRLNGAYLGHGSLIATPA
jgi:gamma-glutamyltranspeptidase